MAEWRFDAIGVPWSIETAQDIEPSTRQRISDRIAAFDRAYSRFREDSLVAEVAKKPGDYVFPDDLSDLLAVYDRLFQATRGAINPLVGRALEHWGYDANYRLAPHAGHPPPVPSLKESISVTGSTLHAPRPVLLDIGAVGKGFLVDRVSDLLLEAGLDDCVVDGSGDIRHRGEHNERVGLEHPDHPDRVVGVARLQNQSLAASATNRRSWPGAHHILDAVTGRPTESIRASWVVADSCALADGLATALFTTEPETLTTHFSFQWAVLDRDNQLVMSPSFPGEVFQ